MTSQQKVIVLAGILTGVSAVLVLVLAASADLIRDVREFLDSIDRDGDT